MKRLGLAVFSLSVLALAACTSAPVVQHFGELGDQNMPRRPAKKAQIVFIEPVNPIQGMHPVGLFEVSDDARIHLATTGARTKTALNFTPGRHLLMALQLGGRAHFLEVDVEAGKRYYVLERFVYGKGVQLQPLRTDGLSDFSTMHNDFPAWISESRFVKMTPESVEIFEKNKDSVNKTQAEGWKVWNEKTPQQRADLTLNPTDAVFD